MIKAWQVEQLAKLLKKYPPKPDLVTVDGYVVTWSSGRQGKTSVQMECFANFAITVKVTKETVIYKHNT